MESRVRIKDSTLAGTWYPEERDRLGAMVDRFLAEALPGDGRPLLGAVVPHAGYQYSGSVAAEAYRRLRDTPCRRVVILAPSHRASYRGVAVLQVDAFRSPLGSVRVDPVVEELPARELMHADPKPFAGEHSLEIQLPFLQRVLPDTSVVPLLFGAMTPADHAALAATLEWLCDDETIFVVSSDFTHYGWRFAYEPFPARNAEYVRERLRELDMGAIEPILRGDASAFQTYLEDTGATVCGHVPITSFLTWTAARRQAELLTYRTSLDVTGDYEHCVSYAAIAFPREVR
jgi:hypothetical protein